MNILITGVSGFIGSNLAHWLIKNTDHTVIGIDNYLTGYPENMPQESERFKFQLCSINDTKQLKLIFEFYKLDVTYHAAAYASEGRSNFIRSFIHSNNTVGTANIINACVNHKCKLIFLSSVAIYFGVPPYTEEMIEFERPLDEYGLSKLVSERSIQIAGTEQGLDWVIIRPRNVFGPRQCLVDPSRNVFGIWMNQIRHGEPMTIYGTGGNKRSFTYIDDILKPLYNAIGVSREIINLGSSKVYTILEANKCLRRVANYEIVAHLEPRNEVVEAFCETEKSERLLGFKDKTELIEGLRKMWEWAQVQPDRHMIKPPDLEVTEGAHSSIK